MKRKRDKGQGGRPASPLPAVLEAYGERFMSMFDDYDELQAKQEPQAAPAAAGGPGRRPRPPGSSTESTGDSGGSSSSEEDGAHGQQQKQKQRRHNSSSGRNGAEAPPVGELDAFLSGRKGSVHRSGGSAAAAVAPSSKAQQEAQRLQQEQQRLLERRLKKRFMSSKVSRIFAEGEDDASLGPRPAAATGRRKEDERDGPTAEEFAKMRREVELLGASALDKRSAKAWRASMLAQLGAAADKAPRTPAKIGHGMAKKARQREAAALQEAIAAGMVKAKGRGKKMRALKAKQRDRGLMEAGRGFKCGVLRLRGPPPASG